MNGQLALENQPVATKDTKGPSILKGTGCVRGVTALTMASLPGWSLVVKLYLKQ